MEVHCMSATVAACGRGDQRQLDEMTCVAREYADSFDEWPDFRAAAIKAHWRSTSRAGAVPARFVAWRIQQPIDFAKAAIPLDFAPQPAGHRRQARF
jgi:hypothetical protein